MSETGLVALRTGHLMKGPPMAGNPEPRPPSRAEPREPSGGTGLQILLIEDDASRAERLSLMLRRDGHRVQVAPDGRSAVNAAATRAADVVLLGGRAPDADWQSLLRRLRRCDEQRGKQAFLIALNRGEGAAGSRPTDEGADLHLGAPVDPDLLRWVLKRFHRVVQPPDATAVPR